MADLFVAYEDAATEDDVERLTRRIEAASARLQALHAELLPDDFDADPNTPPES